jgi:hypothetical protein
MARIVTSSFGGIFVLLGIAQLAIGKSSIIWWVQFDLGLVALVIGTVADVRVGRKIRRSEREHGTAAGKQQTRK